MPSRDGKRVLWLANGCRIILPEMNEDHRVYPYIFGSTSFYAVPKMRFEYLAVPYQLRACPQTQQQAT